MTFLADILKRKREEVDARKALVSESALEKTLGPGPALSPGRFHAALQPTGAASVAVIAEVKRASPSVGAIDPGIDAPGLAQQYAAAGAAAISVLTDGPGFGGSLEDLRQVRARVAVPLLRKDFIVDRYQLLEAKIAGADAILLIVAALSPTVLSSLQTAALSLGLDVLVEVHDDAELDVALAEGATIVGVNNRDLKSFRVDLAVSERLIPRIPATVRAIAESGVRGPAEVTRLRAVGTCNFLIGEALVRSGDPRGFLEQLRLRTTK